MIDHLVIKTTQELHEATVAFYAAALEPLGYRKSAEFLDGKVVGFGIGDAPGDFWVSVGNLAGGPERATIAHFAFGAKDQSTVDKFYKAGLKAGGKDNGAPGLRPMYHNTYYGAFLIDPIGNNAEVVNRADRPT